MNILSYDDFAKLCHLIMYFRQLNQNYGKRTLFFLSHQFQEPLNVRRNLIESESGLFKTDTKIYHDFTIDNFSVETTFLQ